MIMKSMPWMMVKRKWKMSKEKIREGLVAMHSYGKARQSYRQTDNQRLGGMLG